MAKKKKTEEIIEQISTEEIIEESVKEQPTDFTEIMNPPVKEKEIKEEVKAEQPKRKVMQFTPLGPVIKYI